MPMRLWLIRTTDRQHRPIIVAAYVHPVFGLLDGPPDWVDAEAGGLV